MSDLEILKLSESVYLFVSMQYFYNPHTQQYMYWDGENHTYTPVATEQASAEITPLSTASPDSSMTPPSNKEKKDKPKSKTAQQVKIMSHVSTKLNFKLLRMIYPHLCLWNFFQIAKDMERWAKSLNRQKENMRSVSSSSAVSLAPLPAEYAKVPGHSHNRRESASADAAYSVMEKKVAV